MEQTYAQLNRFASYLWNGNNSCAYCPFNCLKCSFTNQPASASDPYTLLSQTFNSTCLICRKGFVFDSSTSQCKRCGSFSNCQVKKNVTILVSLIFKVDCEKKATFSASSTFVHILKGNTDPSNSSFAQLFDKINEYGSFAMAFGINEFQIEELNFNVFFLQGSTCQANFAATTVANLLISYGYKSLSKVF